MKKYISMLLFITILATSVTFVNVSADNNNNNNTSEVNIYVDSMARSGKGTEENPFTTITQARDYIANIDKSKDDIKYNVLIKPGTYTQTESIQFSKKDSGTVKNPITYKKYGEGEVEILGGVNFSKAKIQPVTDRITAGRLVPSAKNNIVQVDLKSQGISDLGPQTRIGVWYKEEAAGSEFFVNGQSMNLAKYPNEGFIKTGKVIDPGSSNGTKFELQPTETRAARWRQAADPMVFGFFAWDWADESMEVDSIDTKKGIIKTKGKHAYQVLQDKRFYIYNLMEEIDKPGEYYIDKENGILYMYPPDGFENSEKKMEISLLDKPLVNIDGASNLRFEGLSFKVSRDNGVYIRSGDNNVVYGCKFYNLGRNAGDIRGGVNNGFDSCEVTATGKGGFYIGPGDRTTLTPGNSYAKNNEIYACDRITKTSSPGIWLYGVGNTAANNRIHDLNHVAILFGGNDNIIEYNEIYKVCQETADAGAIYAGRYVSNCGNVLRYNYLHDINSTITMIHGIYLDDYQAWTHVYGNVFKNVAEAVFMHGGDYNIIENNVFIDSRSARIVLCGYTFFFGEGVNASGQAPEVSDEVRLWPIKSDIWRKKYPLLVPYLDGEPKLPKHTYIQHNYSYNSDASVKELGAENHANVLDNYEILRDDDHKTDGGFVDYANGDFTLREDAQVFKEIKDFEAPPFEKMGLISNEYTDKYIQTGKINLVYPKDNAKDVQVNRLTLLWDKQMSVTDYKITVATDKMYKNVVFEGSTTVNSIAIPILKYDMQKYYWKVEGNDYTKGGYKRIKSAKEFTFTSAKQELAIKDNLIANLELANRVYEELVVGTEPSMVAQDVKDKLKAVIDKADKLYKKTFATQDDVDSVVSELIATMRSVDVARIGETIDFYKMASNKKGWKFDSDAMKWESDGTVSFTPKQRVSNICGYVGEKIQNYQKISFDVQWDIKNMWEGFGLRSRNTDNVAWGGNYQYLIVIKGDQIELQRFAADGNETIKVVKNTFTKPNVRQHIELGAVDVADGVQLTMSIDGKEVFNEIDKKYIAQEGFFTLYSFSEAGLKILPPTKQEDK